MAESFGVEDRGHFYDPVGALRDVVVNHLMQVVAASAMEAPSEPNQLIVKLDPTTGIRLIVEAHRADEPGAKPITLDMEFAKQGGEGPTRTRCSCTRRWSGTPPRFTRQDAIEETWRVMQPLLDAPPPVHPYAQGSMGPEAAD